MKNFSLADFCDKYNKDFKKYYNYLNNPLYTPVIYSYLYTIHSEKMKEYIKSRIKKEKKYIKEKLEIVNNIILFYKQNNLINKSDIGKFLTYYENCVQKKDLNDINDLFNLFYELINYDNIINVLKECFYIFSNYRSCIYFLTPKINFNIPNSKNKILLKNIIKTFNDNLYSLIQIISKTYIGDKNPFGSPYYSIIYGMFDTLNIIKKYFSNPLKECNIDFKSIKISNKKDIIKNLCIEYNSKKLKDNKLDYKINDKNINTISQFILILKRIGYDLWFVIPLVFNTIFKKYTLKYKKKNDLNIDAPILNHTKIYYQKKNIEIGVKMFILVQENYITNTNIFQNFND
jgi:hypothetical protein